MYNEARKYRADLKAKAHKMAGGDPHQKVDCSDWSEAEPMNMDKPTGIVPVSKRAYKKGGRVEGAKEIKRADRKPRASGGMTANDYVNRDVKAANEERPGGKAHVGGYASGGNVGDTVPTSRMSFTSGPSQASKAMGLKRGGIGKITDANEEKGGREARKHGGRADAHWIEHADLKKGALHRELHVPEEERIPAKKLAKAGHSGNKLVAKRAHLAETLEHLPRKSGGRTGKTTVNIVIGAKNPDNGAGDMTGGAPMPPRPVPLPPAQPPPMPPQAMPGGPAPMGGGMPLPRKDGGRAKYPDMDFGAGSGKGRLEKIREYGKEAR